MSFGFSVCEFIGAFKLASRIRKDFVGAPGQFKNISEEMRNLSVVLQDVDVALSEHKLVNEDKAHLAEIASSCHNVLEKLQRALENSGEWLNADIAELLLESGAKIDAMDNDGRTALIAAAKFGTKTVAKLLLNRLANANVKDKDGNTPLDLAKLEKNDGVIKLLKSADTSRV